MPSSPWGLAFLDACRDFFLLEASMAAEGLKRLCTLSLGGSGILSLSFVSASGWLLSEREQYRNNSRLRPATKAETGEWLASAPDFIPASETSCPVKVDPGGLQGCIPPFPQASAVAAAVFKSPSLAPFLVYSKISRGSPASAHSRETSKHYMDKETWV